MKQCNYSREALFQLNGIPPLGMSISLALQHLEPIPKLTIDMYEFTPNNDSAGKMNEG